jgi:hypothetical protein
MYKVVGLRVSLFFKLGEENKGGFKCLFFPSLKGFFFGCGVLVNKGVLINGIVKGDGFLNELVFSKSYFLGGVGWLRKKGGGGYSF